MKLSEKLQEEIKGQYEALKYAESIYEATEILRQIEKTKEELKNALKLEERHPELN